MPKITVMESSGHGKNVAGNKRTSTFQVRNYCFFEPGDYLIERQFVFKVADAESRAVAFHNAMQYAERPADAVLALGMAVECGWRGIEWHWVDERKEKREAKATTIPKRALSFQEREKKRNELTQRRNDMFKRKEREHREFTAEEQAEYDALTAEREALT